jgi:hypothetical protein
VKGLLPPRITSKKRKEKKTSLPPVLQLPPSWRKLAIRTGTVIDVNVGIF